MQRASPSPHSFPMNHTQKLGIISEIGWLGRERQVQDPEDPSPYQYGRISKQQYQKGLDLD